MSKYHTRLTDTQRLHHQHAVAQMKAKADYEEHLQSLRPSEIATEANEGTVIEGVAVRKPQPRLT